MFLAAAIGSAVGISNIWKFSYVAGENGGGAFVLVYVFATLFVALPVVVAEFLIGRRGRNGMEGSILVLAERDGISTRWRFYVYLALLGIFLALSFYCVVAGWTVDYFLHSLLGQIKPVSANEATTALNALLADPLRMMLSQALFIGLTSITVAGGVRGGLERALRWLTPGLFIILILLLVYAIVLGDFSRAVKFLLVPEFNQLTPHVILMAVGQAFFSLGAGLGVLLTIGCYMDEKINILQGSVVVALADAGVAIIAGLAIFPIVFAYHLSPAEGPGLIFATLPIAFAQMPGGQFVGTAFFLLMALAAFTSAITIMEAVVAWLETRLTLSRPLLSLLVGLTIWVLGLATIFSFNIWSDVRLITFILPLADKNIFGLLDYLVSNIFFPIGGICIALIAGWGLSKEATMQELGMSNTVVYRTWHVLVRYMVPGAVGAIFIANLA